MAGLFHDAGHAALDSSGLVIENENVNNYI